MALEGAALTGAGDTAGMTRGMDFRSYKWLSNRNIVNGNGEEIAVASDLILDRGSGRVEYLVIKTGTTLGLGGRAVAVPYSAFRWDASVNDRYILGSTVEQLKQYPEYTPEQWKQMGEGLSEDKSTLRQRLATDAATPSDPYAGSFESAKKERVEGEVTNVERVRTSEFGEQVVVIVKVDGGMMKRVALGPSWYVNSTSTAPMRGDKVVVETLALPRDPEQTLAGTELRSGGRTLRLRANDGAPVWAMRTVESGGSTYSQPYTRYLVLSQLKGMKVDARGNDCGKVYDVIVERNSGEVAFLSIDPNQNFLGIGDTKRLIPWSVVTVTLDGMVRTDASKEMVLASTETPSDLATLSTSDRAAAVYKAYGVAMPKFEVMQPTTLAMTPAGNAWAARGTVVSAIERGSAQTMSGTVVDFTDVTLAGENRPARAVKVLINGDKGNEELVLLGPAWYLENQKPLCRIGDTIRVDAARTVIDGKRYWLAKSVECKDSRVVLIDGSNAPVWSQP